MTGTTENLPPHYAYWGKLGKAEHEGRFHRLVYHSLDVAATAERLLHGRPELTSAMAEHCGLDAPAFISLMALVVALHDLGKFSSAFQSQNPHPRPGLIVPGQRLPYDGSEYRHDRLGLYFWGKLEDEVVGDMMQRAQGLANARLLRPILDLLVKTSLGHHGKPVLNDGLDMLPSFTEPHNCEAATAFYRECRDLWSRRLTFQPLDRKEVIERFNQISWHLAGIIVLADWIGSDAQVFGYREDPIPLEDYWAQARQLAGEAVDKAAVQGWWRPSPFLSIRESFGYAPTPLQAWAERIPLADGPQLVILEDVTGAGKTEAALALAHRLMHAGQADGMYFGLPTMATANAMFARVLQFYLSMYEPGTGRAPSIVLAHAASAMDEKFRNVVLAGQPQDRAYSAADETATGQCAAWLADSRKKALLAPVGVGTIDQALLGVLPRKHQSLRLLGLSRKVLIFDEVHAADEYMFELLDGLLSFHLHQGGSAILLTATLPVARRKRLCEIWQAPTQGQLPAVFSHHFPLATQVSAQFGCVESPVATRPQVARQVAVRFLHRVEDCVGAIVAAARAGKCVVWIRNSVDDALAAYDALRGQLPDPAHCKVFHSRFALCDRQQIEAWVLRHFGKQSGRAEREGRVLIATQVFQESLDADADLMISDLCPIDDLIQRAGRLHRHQRQASGDLVTDGPDARGIPTLLVHAPPWSDQPERDWLSRDLPNTQYVYRSPGRLWLGYRMLRQLDGFRMPDDARALIEAVYSVEAQAAIPEALIEAETEFRGENRRRENKGKSSQLDWRQCSYADSAPAWYDDDTEISTRYQDREVVQIVLMRQTAGGDWSPWAGEVPHAVELSTVKADKRAFADLVADEAGDDLSIRLRERFPALKYRLVAVPEQAVRWRYCSERGLSKLVEDPANAGNVGPE